MSGIKGVIKYISQLLILSSFSIIFLPIICLKCYEEKVRYLFLSSCSGA